MNLKRGNVFWVNLDPTVGSEIRKKRPCVIIGATPINEARRTVVVIPLSSSGKPKPPVAIEVQCLGRKAIAVIDQIRAIDKTRLIEQAGNISKDDLKKIDEALKVIIGL